ncbi:MAG: DUF1579 family protein [Deltaproteobacteria bacterium]|nr:DUF1579 family protein [Deltaproteobacteria bacterium]
MKTYTNISITLTLALGLTGSALADAHKEKAADMKKVPAAAGAPAAVKPVEPAKKMEAPKPPPEIAELAKSMVGRWKCVGKAAMNPTDPTAMTDMKTTMTFKLDGGLDKFWITGTMTSQGKPSFKGIIYTTYDAPGKKWHRIGVDNMGGSDSNWSTGLKDGKISWEGEMRMPGMAAMKTRTTETLTKPGKEVSILGEGTMDGKTWMTGWQATCKK